MYWNRKNVVYKQQRLCSQNIFLYILACGKLFKNKNLRTILNRIRSLYVIETCANTFQWLWNAEKSKSSITFQIRKKMGTDFKGIFMLWKHWNWGTEYIIETCGNSFQWLWNAGKSKSLIRSPNGKKLGTMFKGIFML